MVVVFFNDFTRPLYVDNHNFGNIQKVSMAALKIRRTMLYNLINKISVSKGALGFQPMTRGRGGGGGLTQLKKI